MADIVEWTEGVCDDGAAILRDGEMIPITDLLATLNQYEAEILRLRSLLEWRPIEEAQPNVMVWAWGPLWRHAFPAQRNGDHGAVYVDTCEIEAKGRQEYATHFLPLPSPPQGEGK